MGVMQSNVTFRCRMGPVYYSGVERQSGGGSRGRVYGGGMPSRPGWYAKVARAVIVRMENHDAGVRRIVFVVGPLPLGGALQREKNSNAHHLCAICAPWGASVRYICAICARVTSPQERMMTQERIAVQLLSAA